MKISVFKGEHGFESADSHYPSKVYIDGVLIKRAMRLDDVEGWVDVHAEKDGKLQFSKDYDVVTERIYGNVKVVKING